MSAEAATPMEGVAPTAEQPPVVASETLYIQNLNEKIKIDGLPRILYADWISKYSYVSPSVLKASLRGLFKNYGTVLDVVAHRNLRMRGQAFVSFESSEIASKALKEVKGFPLYSKPMV